MDYESTLKELNNLLEEMESKDISLDEMMKNYKKAMDLYQQLNNYLDEYKNEIKEVTKQGLKDLDGEEDILNDEREFFNNI